MYSIPFTLFLFFGFLFLGFYEEERWEHAEHLHRGSWMILSSNCLGMAMFSKAAERYSQTNLKNQVTVLLTAPTLDIK